MVNQLINFYYISLFIHIPFVFQLLISIVGPKSYRQLQDVHRLAKLLQRIRDICVNTGGLIIHNGCGSMEFTACGRTSTTPSCTSSNELNNLSVNSKPNLSTNCTATTVDEGPRLTSSSYLWSQDKGVFAKQLRLPYIAQREIVSY